MARSLGNTIADSLALGLSYSKRLLNDVEPEKFSRLAAADGAAVQSNHAAFVYGHLSLYAAEILAAIGADTPDTQAPAAFTEVFAKDKSCEDDPEGTKYPSMEEITSFFFRAYEAAGDALRETDDDVLQQTNPTEGRLGELFPTIGSMLNFYAGGHLMVHLGQMSAWRRMMGLGAA